MMDIIRVYVIAREQRTDGLVVGTGLLEDLGGLEQHVRGDGEPVRLGRLAGRAIFNATAGADLRGGLGPKRAAISRLQL